MARERRSLQERIRERQRSNFVGRQGQVIQYRENLGLPVDDERRRFVFNIHGDAGVGKTFLTRQLQQTASGTGALTAYMDETVEDVTSAMRMAAHQFCRKGVKLGDFEKRATEYQQRRHELESDPHAPDGIAAFLTKTAVTFGLSAARDVPVAGSLLASVNTAAAADQVNRAREYLARKFSDHSVMRLLLSPAEELTPVFVAGLNSTAVDRTIALFFDTYERTGLILDYWLHDLYTGRYGDLPETLVTTISGQKPLSPNRWGDCLPVIADIPLEPFSEAEARQFLVSKHITDDASIQVILTLSGRLPLWLATLADARPQVSMDIGDPTGDAVERFLKWEDDTGRRDIAKAAALPRTLNQDVLAVITSAGKVCELFAWLRELPFVSQRGDSWVYHDIVRAAMLRLRRAEAPAEWRSQHNVLAQANAHWADEASKGAESGTWTNPDWIDYTREETYHLLCADPHGNLVKALSSAVKAAEHSTTRARQWAALIADAGQDTRNTQLREWGQRLTDGICDGDLVTYLTCLINDAHLDDDVLTVALKERGEGRRIARQGDSALADFTRAIELDPRNAWVIGRRGETHLLLMKRYDKALADFNHAIKLDPDLAWAIHSRGLTYLAMARYDEALADFNRVIELRPDRTWPIDGRGEAYRLLGRYDEALADFNRVIELEPQYDWTIGSRGQTYQAMGRYDEALADFNRVIELEPQFYWAIGGRGQTYRLIGRYDEALADLNHAIELKPDQPWTIGSRGETYRAMGRYDEALADLNHAIELEPDLAWAIRSRGQTYRAMGRYDEALADFNRVIELKPSDDDHAAEQDEIRRLIATSEDDLPQSLELEPPSATWEIFEAVKFWPSEVGSTFEGGGARVRISFTTGGHEE